MATKQAVQPLDLADVRFTVIGQFVFGNGRDLAEAKSVARTMLQQIGNRTLAAVNPSMLTYGTLANGDTVLRFLTGGTNGKRNIHA